MVLLQLERFKYTMSFARDFDDINNSSPVVAIVLSLMKIEFTNQLSNDLRSQVIE